MNLRIFALTLLVATLVGPTGACQELLPTSEKTRYLELQIAPGKNEIVGIAALPTGEAAPPGVTPYITSLHFFNRKAKTKVALTPVVGPAEGDDGDRCDLKSIAFTPDGKKFVAGGWCFFGGWTSPKCHTWFTQRGSTEFDYPEIMQFATAKQGSRIAYVSIRTKRDMLGKAVKELKLTLWENMLKDDIVFQTLDALAANPITASLSSDGNFLAHHHSDKKKLTIHDVADEAKEHAAFDLKLPDVLMFRSRPAIEFAHDNSMLWVLCKEKLYPFDLKAKKAQNPIEFEREPFDMHVLADGSYILFADIDGKGKDKQTFLNLFNPKTRKIERRVGLGKTVAPVTISPDDELLAGCGTEAGILLWEVPKLLNKAPKGK
jgi:hypothetical protein